MTPVCSFVYPFITRYATKVGERGVRISGGQKQRIALARVFLRKPRLLFLDEATSALDAESEGAVQDALDRLIARKDSTVILVAHRLSTVINADKIAVVNNGKIAECGTHNDLLKLDDGIYHRLVSKQMERQANQLTEVGAEGQRNQSLDTVDDLLDDGSEGSGDAGGGGGGGGGGGRGGSGRGGAGGGSGAGGGRGGM